MGTLIIEFDIPKGSEVQANGRLEVELGNGVRMYVQLPEGTGRVTEYKMQLVMEIEGNIHSDSQLRF